MGNNSKQDVTEIHTIHVITNYPITNVMRKPKMSGRMAKWPVNLSTYDIKYEPRSAIKSQALAEFVADSSDDILPEVELERKELQKEEVMGR